VTSAISAEFIATPPTIQVTSRGKISRMSSKLLLLISALLCATNAVDGFLNGQPHQRPSVLNRGLRQAAVMQRRPFICRAAVDGEGSEAAKEESPAPPAAAAAAADPTPVLKPREDAAVELSVQRVLQKPTMDEVRQAQRSAARSVASNMNSDDSLEMLLQDARLMKERQGDDMSTEEGGDIKAKIRDALSTIVTVDFFIVCGFLLWFLLGIFCSSVLRDDTVQIAFNNNFEAFVQPALGVLMIAALVGNFFKEEEPEF